MSANSQGEASDLASTSVSRSQQLNLGISTEKPESQILCRGIFSANYLERHFKDSEGFPTADEVKPFYEATQNRWHDKLPGLRKQKEAYTRTAFLDPLIVDLGWQFIPEANLPKGLTQKRPDYCEQAANDAFFEFTLADNDSFCSLEEFRLFVALFRPQVYARDGGGRCPLDSLREESLNSQAVLESNLRKRIFDVLEDLASGFRDYSANGIKPADFPALYDNSLIFLYRLLFVLYAESRGLLPVKPHGYGSNKVYREKFSLAGLVADLRDKSKFSDNSFTLAVLRLNLLDPAMGSGHFLVRGTEWLAEQIVYHPTMRVMTEQIVHAGPNRRTKEEILNAGRVPVPPGVSQEQAEIAYWRRRVVEACIYGVDVNPLAVELASSRSGSPASPSTNRSTFLTTTCVTATPCCGPRRKR